MVITWNGRKSCRTSLAKRLQRNTGWMGHLIFQQVSDMIDCFSLPFTRFAARQKNKLQPIDNFTENRVNDAWSCPEKLDVHAIDHGCGRLADFGWAGSVGLRLSPTAFWSSDQSMVQLLCERAGHMPREQQRACPGQTTVKYTDSNGVRRCVGLKTELMTIQLL